MATLYLRNVPDDVVERLQRLAAREGLSVSATAVRELASSTRRVDNAALFTALTDRGVSLQDIVEGIRADRDSR